MDDAPPPAPTIPAATTPAGNLPEYTVSEISGAVKRTLETAFGRVRVRGEITELKRYPSGHIYLSLKDEAAKIAAVIWKGSVSKLGLKPENGVEVIATGRVTAYGERSSYQLIIERIEYAGVGALLARIEMLRQRLAAEGLFDSERKRAIPRLPSVIGVVSSSQGAVWQDIKTTVQRRFPRRLILWPVPVQGEGAAARIAAAIAGFDAIAPGGAVPRPDVLIVARGGGSLEDLMAFNDEAVLRAVAACRIPVISAVGHETDTTLIDHVSDRRAPTPTAAAELAVPSRAELVADLAHQASRLAGGLHRMLQAGRLRLNAAGGALPDLPALLGAARQRLDDRALRLAIALPNLLAGRRAGFAATGTALRTALLHAVRARRDEAGRVLPRLSPTTLASLLRERRASHALAGAALRAALLHAVRHRRDEAGLILPRLGPAPLASMLRERRARLEGMAARLEGVSPLGVLARGYALVTDAKGRPVVAAAGVAAGASLTLRFADGEAKVRAEGRQGRLPL